MTDRGLNAAAVASPRDGRGTPYVRINCPHCGSPARARTSKPLGPLYREITYQCQNVECGHTYVAGLEVVRTLSPSATPNPNVHIPLSPHARHTGQS